jgi:Mg2+ and Co2+ transporter CorA
MSSSQMQVEIKELNKRCQEVNKIASYSNQLKTELSETNNVSYNKRTEAYLGQLMKETATLYQNLKQIKENGKGKDKNIVS